MMENNNLIQLKRIIYNNTLKIRVNNQNDIEHLKLMLKNNYSVKNRVLLDEKIRYDQELKSELIELDSEINYQDYGKNNGRV